MIFSILNLGNATMPKRLKLVSFNFARLFPPVVNSVNTTFFTKAFCLKGQCHSTSSFQESLIYERFDGEKHSCNNLMDGLTESSFLDSMQLSWQNASVLTVYNTSDSLKLSWQSAMIEKAALSQWSEHHQGFNFWEKWCKVCLIIIILDF